MHIKAIYHYASDDQDFISDCYHTEVFVNDRLLILPFEQDYPLSHTKAFIAGILVGNHEATLNEVEIADLDL